MKALLTYISQKHNFKIDSAEILSGGDISQVYKLVTDKDNFVLKLNDKTKINVFKCEVVGLNKIAEQQIIRTPRIIDFGIFENHAYLLMELIERGIPNQKTFQNFGKNLAHLHHVSQAEFGFEDNNFIGNLRQSNNSHRNWSAFFWQERIQPQLALAMTNGFLYPKDLPSEEKFITVCNNEFCFHSPALLHGDLWNGNFLIDTHSTVVLIDPAIYFGHPMMDIGMTKLFGGFPQQFYDVYFSNLGIDGNIQYQIELAQLYYLLVHLNLFGMGYHAAVMGVLKKYFG